MLSSVSSDAVMCMNGELLFAILAILVILSAHFAFNFDVMTFVMYLRHCSEADCSQCTDVLVLNWLFLKHCDSDRGARKHP